MKPRSRKGGVHTREITHGQVVTLRVGMATKETLSTRSYALEAQMTRDGLRVTKCPEIPTMVGRIIVINTQTNSVQEKVEGVTVPFAYPHLHHFADGALSGALPA